MKKISIKREQSQAGLSFAEREKFRPQVKNKLLLLLALLLTAATGAWAANTVTWTAQNQLPTLAGKTTATFDGVTITTTSAITENGGRATFNGAIFSVEDGNITKIVLKSVSGVSSYPAGWTISNNTEATWTGSAKSVSCGYSGGVYNIEFTIETVYTVTMAEGTVDATNWSIEPKEGLSEGDQVTIQYNGRLKVKGVKAVKKAKPAAVTYIGTKSPTEAKAVGDIVFSDGSATAYTSGLTLTDEQKAAAVAVIFYAGSASDILGAKTLGVGLKNTNDETTKYLAFARNASGTAEGYNTNITAIQCTPSESGDGKAATATFTGDLDGSDNWTALCAAVNDEGTSGNYPAWEWVNAYATTANLTGEYASGWYLPTVAELCMLYRAKDTVNAALEKADGTIIVDNYYWSSSQSSSTNNIAWMVKFDSGKLIDTYKGNKWYVCGVRAFN